MKKELSDMLLEYLGQLMCDLDAEFDWIEKDAIKRKINAVHELVGIEERKKSWFEGIDLRY